MQTMTKIIVKEFQGKSDESVSESKQPPQAMKNSEIDSDPSVPGPEGGAKRRASRRELLEGSVRIVCRRCKGFLAEIKSPDFEALFFCPRCKMENMFSFKKL
jgi:hypothetical protein